MMLAVTPAAAARIEALQGAATGLRIDLQPGGCCGTHYAFSIGPTEPGDVTLTVGQAKVHLSPAAAAVLRGARLDYGAQLKPPRFRILRNPNTPQKCPCGRSFGASFPGKSTPQCQAYCPMPWDIEPDGPPSRI